QLIAPAVAGVALVRIAALGKLRQRHRRVELALAATIAGLRRQAGDLRVTTRREDARRRAQPFARAAYALTGRLSNHRAGFCGARRLDARRAAEHLCGRSRSIFGTLGHPWCIAAHDVIGLAELILMRTL